MSAWPDHPVIYEVDTWVWLQDLSEREGTTVHLDDVPDTEWDSMALPGIDAVWLMGVWERSAEGQRIARGYEAFSTAARKVLPDFTDEDIVASPYCVRRYVVDDRMGGAQGLATARRQLQRRGLRLLLDYVPNHVAPDHPWVKAHPDYFVRGSGADIEAHPEAYLQANGNVLARGRDPYFPPWPDVVQLDAYNEATRAATIEVLSQIADQCDGVRCDMAMLLLNDIFGRTWGEHIGQPPGTDFWSEVIAGVRARHPDMLFLAEAYWDLEWRLQQQGFDYCYDKRLYDRLIHENADSVRAHLWADLDYQHRLVRFLENHDEPRAATTLPPGKEQAAAVIIATLPGATLWHDGQFDGRRIQLPVLLGRRPHENPDPGLRSWHAHLLDSVARSGMRDGHWYEVTPTGWPDDQSFHNLLAWWWSEGDRLDAARHLVVVNLSEEPAHGRVPAPPENVLPGAWWMTDLLSGTQFERDGNELREAGLYVGLEPWGFHVLNAEPALALTFSN